MPISRFVQALLRQVTWANAGFEHEQAQGWAEVVRMLPTAEGVAIGEGLPQTSWLAVQEVTLRFALEEVREGPWARVRRAVGGVFGRATTAVRRFRFAPPGAERPISIQVRVFRKPDGSYDVEQEGTAKLGGDLAPPASHPALGRGGVP